jgi:hypothetical protein
MALGRLADDKTESASQSHPLSNEGFHAGHQSPATQSSLQKLTQTFDVLGYRADGLLLCLRRRSRCLQSFRKPACGCRGLHRRFHFWALADQRRSCDASHSRPERALQDTQGWGCQEVPDRICSARSSRRSSANNQQSLRPQEPTAHHHQHALGALLSRGTASQSIIHTGCVHNLRKKLDCPTLGQSATRTSQNCRGRAGYERPGWRMGPKPRSSA